MAMKKITISLLVIIAILVLVNTARAQTEIISSNLTISQDTTWSGTVVIDGARVDVEQGATLVLKPGTIISSKNGALIYVKGKLRALGKKDEMVRFVAEYNEKPNFSLTYYIDSTAESTIEMEHFILEGGGGNQDTASLPALVIRGKALLTSGIIRRNRISAVRVWSKELEMDDCEIYENESIALENKNTETLKVENNWWGSEEGPTNYTLSNSSRQLVKGALDIDPWQEKGPIPIVILPGFGGSFSFKLLSDKAKDDWWLTPLGTSAYRYFAKALILNNYYHDKDFFWGFYDWRISCENSAKKYLEKIIDNAKEKSNHFQVHIVAHSMGGLVTRSYIEGEGFRDDIDRFIAAGTPHLGASEVYPIWEGGRLLDEKKPFYLYLWYLEALDWDWKKVDYIRKNFSSLGQMMPIYDYLESSFDGFPISYKNQKEHNEFLEDLAEPENMNKLKRKVNTSLIVGNGEKTLEKIKVAHYEGDGSKWVDGIPDPLDAPEDTDNGDGTVTVGSACAGNEITKNIFTLSSSHSHLFESGAKTILEQLKVKAKFPLLFEIMSHFLLTAKGPVDISVENGQSKIVSAGKKEIGDSQYYEAVIDGKKLVFSDFPVDFRSEEAKSLKIIFTGLEKGDFRASFWNFSENGDYFKQEINNPIEKDVRITYEIIVGGENKGKPGIVIKKLTLTNLLQIKFPAAGKKYLNWQIVSPAVNFWKDSEGNISDDKISYELDGEPGENSRIDLGQLSLKSHELKVKASYKSKGEEQNEEKAVDFFVDTSLKSLITLIDRFYREKKITDWGMRSQLINYLAEAYQDASNSRASVAKGKIIMAKDLLESRGGNIFQDGESKDRLEESLEFLETSPR